MSLSLTKTYSNNVEKLTDIILSIEDKDPLYKPLSTIFGAFLGDSMGSYCEFIRYSKDNYLKVFNNNNIFGYPPGHVTDDSEMAMSLAYAIMDYPDINTLNPNYIYFYYSLWKNSGPFDIGRTTATALNMFNSMSSQKIENCFSDNIKKIIGIYNKDSLANGSLMRNSPLTVWYYFTHKSLIENTFKEGTISGNKIYDLFSDICKYTEIDCQTTHPNSEMILADAFCIVLSLSAIYGYDNKQIYNTAKALINSDNFKVKYKVLADKYQKTITRIEKPDILEDKEYNKWCQEFIHSMGYYLHSVNIILFALYHLDFFINKSKELECTLYEAIIYEICNYGGDTDTNAAIVGSVIGPLIGFRNFGDKIWYILSCIDNKRILYNNIFMYFYVYYLKFATEGKIPISDKSKNTQRTYHLINNLNNIEFN